MDQLQQGLAGVLVLGQQGVQSLLGLLPLFGGLSGHHAGLPVGTGPVQDTLGVLRLIALQQLRRQSPGLFLPKGGGHKQAHARHGQHAAGRAAHPQGRQHAGKGQHQGPGGQHQGNGAPGIQSAAAGHLPRRLGVLAGLLPGLVGGHIGEQGVHRRGGSFRLLGLSLFQPLLRLLAAGVQGVELVQLPLGLLQGSLVGRRAIAVEFCLNGIHLPPGRLQSALGLLPPLTAGSHGPGQVGVPLGLEALVLGLELVHLPAGLLGQPEGLGLTARDLVVAGQLLLQLGNEAGLVVLAAVEPVPQAAFHLGVGHVLLPAGGQGGNAGLQGGGAVDGRPSLAHKGGALKDLSGGADEGLPHVVGG